MIAPIRHTEQTQDERTKLLARARRAVAQGLLSRRVVTPPQFGVGPWAVWAFVAWTAAVAASVLFGSWYWAFKPY